MHALQIGRHEQPYKALAHPIAGVRWPESLNSDLMVGALRSFPGLASMWRAKRFSLAIGCAKALYALSGASEIRLACGTFNKIPQNFGPVHISAQQIVPQLVQEPIKS